MIHVGDRVRGALAAGEPVVALESTLITHGLPRPANVETALGMEAAVRAAGATPATVGIVGGRPIIGLTEVEIELLASGVQVTKASRRDLPVLVARGGHGGTTVAATLALIRTVGVRVFATGGIGGVHRGAEQTFDISADLGELARTKALVVCSGAKAILDLSRTLELLETLGVTILGYRTDELPAFYTRNSGLPVTTRVEDPPEAAAIAAARWALDLDGAVLLAVPPPAEVALPADESDAGVAAALAQAEAAGVRGREVTSYLLDRMVEQTAGRSLAANRALLENNARIGGEVAVALAQCSRL